MVRKLKNSLYFLIAGYFRFFARIRLKRWHPRVVVVTGSNGKTTTLNLVELQLGVAARYSHGANSSFGIPFDILGLKRSSYSILEWPLFALLAPFLAWKHAPKEDVYVVEADCDRPYEGEFLSELLKPEVTVWLSCARTHSMNFDKVVATGRFASVDEAIGHEFAHFAKRTSSLVVLNADEPLIMSATHDILRVKIQEIQLSQFTRYDVTTSGTEFTIGGISYRASYLLPLESSYSIAASVRVAEHFGVQPKSDLSQLVLPPGRSSLFRGIKNTTIVDSTYNANLSSVTAVLRMVEKLPGEKWLILGDMTEQGAQEKEEHEKLALKLTHTDFKEILLVGPRLTEYALPILKERALAFETPREALEHITSTLKGGETLVFKGARFLEGVVEHLLADKADAAKLCRRETVWQRRRKKWQL